VSALVGDIGRCNRRSKSSRDKNADEKRGQHLVRPELREMKDDNSCLTCWEHLREDSHDLIYVSVRLQTYKDTVCSTIFPD